MLGGKRWEPLEPVVAALDGDWSTPSIVFPHHIIAGWGVTPVQVT